LEKNSFKINWMALEGLDNPNAWSNQRFGELASLAQSVQTDLESVTLAMCESLREVSNVDNLALAGGVALNSVMNGKIRKQSGFKEVFVPSAPGDEGIALGCALCGLQVRDQSALLSNYVRCLVRCVVLLFTALA